jgi:hypothetical protein
LDNHHPPCTDDNHLSRGDGWIYLGHAVNREAAQLALDADKYPTLTECATAIRARSQA